MTLQPDVIARMIHEAFASVEKPAGKALAPHDCDECASVRRLLEPHTHDAVPVKTLNWLHDSLPLLGPAGLHYYLPAYLVAALRDLDFNGTDMILFHLSPSQDQLAEPYWKDRFEPFTANQKQAVRIFIEWFAASEEESHYRDDLQKARAAWRDEA